MTARGVPLSGEKDGAGESETAAGGGVQAVGAGAGVASVNADLILVDDPIGRRDDAESAAVRDRVWDWLTNDILARCEPHTAVLLTMSRWHQDDPAGRLPDGRAGPWQVVGLPAEAEAGDPLGRAPGEPLWAELRPADVPRPGGRVFAVAEGSVVEVSVGESAERSLCRQPGPPARPAPGARARPPAGGTAAEFPGRLQPPPRRELGLPSGQSVANALGLPALTPDEVARGADGTVAKGLNLHREPPPVVLPAEGGGGEGGRATDGAGRQPRPGRGVRRSAPGRSGVVPRPPPPLWKPTLPAAVSSTFTMADLVSFVGELTPDDGPAA